MIFNSFSFIVFFIIVLLLYFVFPYKYRVKFLLVASYFFYMSWNAMYALLMLLSTCITYCSGILIVRYAEKKKKRFILAMSFIANLSILFLFKYLNFISDSVSYLASLFQADIHLLKIDVLLPVGISFYTFQALSYSMDVYKSKIDVERNFFRYALFVSFFPQLVAGPIEKSKNLLPQFIRDNDFSFSRAKEGMIIILWGFFKKILIANRLSIYVDAIYNDVEHFGTLELLFATFLFAIQIYCDFSGYSDIAIGTAKILGYDLMKNFNRPYFAKSISDFWHRWHISLSTWFQEYLYIPLGGNRVSKSRHLFNLFITFLISGLWHGANWTFVIWGALHGAAIILENLFSSRYLNLNCFNSKSLIFHKVLSYIRILTVFVFVCFTWIFFRADNIHAALLICSKISTGIFDVFDYYNFRVFISGINFANFNNTINNNIITTMVLISVLFLFIVEFFQKDSSIVELLSNKSIALKYIFYIVIILFLLFSGLFISTSFIYFQF